MLVYLYFRVFGILSIYYVANQLLTARMSWFYSWWGTGTGTTDGS